jgi:hypothetical protein
MNRGEAAQLLGLLQPIESILKQLQNASQFLSSELSQSVNNYLSLIQRRIAYARAVVDLEAALAKAERDLFIDGSTTFPRAEVQRLVQEALIQIQRQVLDALALVQLDGEPRGFVVVGTITREQYDAF